MAVGGADLAASFLAEAWWTSSRLYVHPVLVGRGKRLFPEADSTVDLGLVQTRVFGNGVVLLHYARPLPRARRRAERGPFRGRCRAPPRPDFDAFGRPVLAFERRPVTFRLYSEA